MVLTQKEADALQIAGFSSVGELLARYFELVKVKNELDNRLPNVIGSNKCQVNLEYRPNLYP